MAWGGVFTAVCVRDKDNCFVLQVRRSGRPAFRDTCCLFVLGSPASAGSARARTGCRGGLGGRSPFPSLRRSGLLSARASHHDHRPHCSNRICFLQAVRVRNLPLNAPSAPSTCLAGWAALIAKFATSGGPYIIVVSPNTTPQFMGNRLHFFCTNANICVILIEPCGIAQFFEPAPGMYTLIVARFYF